MMASLFGAFMAFMIMLAYDRYIELSGISKEDSARFLAIMIIVFMIGEIIKRLLD